MCLTGDVVRQPREVLSLRAVNICHRNVVIEAVGVSFGRRLADTA